MKTRLSFAVMLAVFAIPAFGAYDAFMKFGAIKGDVPGGAHKDWIEVSSFSLGTTHGGGTPRVTLTVRQGTYLPQLAQLSASGKHTPTVVVDVANQRYTFQDVIVTSYSAASTGGGTAIPGASLTLGYSHYSMEVAARPPQTPGESVMPANDAHVAIAPPNAQVIVNGIAGERFDLLALRFSSEHDGLLKIRQSSAPGSFFSNRVPNGKVTIKKDNLTFTLTNCTITSFLRNADGTSTAGFHFDQYYGPAGGY